MKLKDIPTIQQMSSLKEIVFVLSSIDETLSLEYITKNLYEKEKNEFFFRKEHQFSVISLDEFCRNNEN